MEYCSDIEASHKVNTPLFPKLENITEDTYEVDSCEKTSVISSKPNQLFCLPECKTSHASISLRFLRQVSSPLWFSNVQDGHPQCLHQGDFALDKCNWFPRMDTPKHKAYDKCTPDLFIVEWEGQGVNRLCRHKHITVLGQKISSGAKELTRNATRST